MILLTANILLTGQERSLTPPSEKMPGTLISDKMIPCGLHLKRQLQSSYSPKKLLFTGMAERLDSIIGMTLPSLPGNNHLMSKQVYQYNLLQLNTSETGYLWNSLLQLWTPNQKIEYTYYQNNSQYLSSLISSRWDSIGQQWLNVFGYQYDYDSSYHLTRITYLGDSIVTGNLKPYSKSELLYSGSPLRLTEMVVYLRQMSGIWDVQQKTEYSYDGNSNRVLLESTKYWIDSTSSWSPVYIKTEYTYNPDFSLKSDSSFAYSLWTSQFVPMHDYSYTYNALGKMTGRVYSEYDYLLNQYLPSNKMERNFSMNGLVDWHNEYTYMPLIQQWSTARTTTFVRDTSAVTYSLLLPYWIESDNDLIMNVYGSKKVLETPGWEWDSLTSTMVNNSIAKYYYSSQLISIDNPEKSKVKIFPNPVKDWLIIDISESTYYTFRIIDLQGRKILEKPFSGSTSIDMTGLKDGIYLYRIIDGKHNTVYQGKVMVFR